MEFDRKNDVALDPVRGTRDGRQPPAPSVLRLGAVTARILAGTMREPPADLHLDEVRIVVPASFVRISSAADAQGLLRAPDLYVVPPGERLHLRVDPGSEAILVAMETLLCEERAIRVQGRPARVSRARAGTDTRLRDAAEAFAREMSTDGQARDAAWAEARCDELALHMASTYGTVDAPTSCAGLARPRLERVLAFIDEHLQEVLPVSQLAQSVHLSPFHFSRMFRVSTGRSPHEWIMLKRMARAKALLACTRMPLPEVARGAGYRTHSHFSGMFHAVVGMTPGQYRARHA